MGLGNPTGLEKYLSGAESAFLSEVITNLTGIFSPIGAQDS